MGWRIEAYCDQCKVSVTTGRNVLTERPARDDEALTIFSFREMLRAHEVEAHEGKA